MKTGIIMLCLIPTVFLSACSDNTYEADSVPESGVISAVTEESSEESSVTEKSETESSSETETTAESETEKTKTEKITSETTSEKTETESTSENSETQTEAPEKTEVENETSEISETETAQTSKKITEPDFSGESAVKIIYGKKCVSLEEITDVKKFFGNPPSPEISAPSCLGEGEDIVYSYDGFTVSEFKGTDGKSYVTSIIITGESVKTPKGVNVGSDENDALAALGDYYYEEGKYSLSFFAENGKVTEVDVTMLM